MDDLISRRAAIDEIEYELEMINSALDSTTLNFNARERLRQRRGEVREILNSIQQLPSTQPEIIRCRNCKFASGDSRICMKFGHSPIGELDFCAWAERRTDDKTNKSSSC